MAVYQDSGGIPSIVKRKVAAAEQEQRETVVTTDTLGSPFPPFCAL